MKQGLLIDMDGVIYGGDEMIKGADVLISTLLTNEIPFLFMTNNSQRTRLEGVRKLKKAGHRCHRRSYLHQCDGNRAIPGGPGTEQNRLCVG